MDETTRVGILGGTGKLGAGLARRWADAGVDVTIGSRDPGRATTAAADLAADLGDGAVHLRGAGNAEAAACPVVVAAVPAAGADALVRDLSAPLAGAVLVSAISPLAFDADGPRPVGAVGGGSAAERLAEAVPDARVVAGFHTVSAVTLRRSDPLDEDVLLCGDDDAALEEVARLVDRLGGARPVAVGPLRLAGALEALTAVLIATNRRHGAHAGVRFTRLERSR